MTKIIDRELTKQKKSPPVKTRIEKQDLDLNNNRFECEGRVRKLLEFVHRQHPLTEDIHDKWFLHSSKTGQPIYEVRLRIKPILKEDPRR